MVSTGCAMGWIRKCPYAHPVSGPRFPGSPDTAHRIGGVAADWQVPYPPCSTVQVLLSETQYVGYTAGRQREYSPRCHAGTVDDTEMWRALLHDGPLVNLTLLAEAIVSHDDVGPSKLSLSWKTLDHLLKGLGLARTEVSDSALARFKVVHNKTRERVQTGDRGFGFTPLLKILDTVTRG